MVNLPICAIFFYFFFFFFFVYHDLHRLFNLHGLPTSLSIESNNFTVKHYVFLSTSRSFPTWLNHTTAMQQCNMLWFDIIVALCCLRFHSILCEYQRIRSNPKTSCYGVIFRTCIVPNNVHNTIASLVDPPCTL